jgi:anti-sigma factor RsiW
MKCCEARAYLEAYADSELATDRALDVEAHLSDCGACQAELSLSRTVCQLTRSACACAPMPAEFEARLREKVREEGLDREHQNLATLPLSWSAITPLAAAAAAAFWFNFSTNRPAVLGNGEETAADVMNAATGPEQLVEALVQHHTHSQIHRPRFIDTMAVSNLEPTLGLPIHPPDLARYGAHFEGASIVNVRSTHAASLHYTVGNHRFTLYVYDPDELPLRTLRDLEPRVVGDRAVFVGQRRGYSIAACESQGVGYAVAADLSDDESAELVAALDD